MAKKIPADIARQIKQLGEGVVEEVKEVPKGVTSRAMEQLGMSSVKEQTNQEKKSPQLAKPQPEKTKGETGLKEQQQIAQLRQGLEKEIRERQRLREQETQRRREQASDTQPPEAVTPQEPLKEPSGKPRGFWGRRIKAAQEEAKPELGKRISG